MTKEEEEKEKEEEEEEGEEESHHCINAVHSKLLCSDFRWQLERLRHGLQQVAVGRLEFLRKI